MRPSVVRRAKQLEYVTFAVANMNTAGRLTESPRGLRQVRQPAKALLLLDGNPRGVDMLLAFIGALELLARPELDGCQAQRHAFGGHHQTGVQEQSAHGVENMPSFDEREPTNGIQRRPFETEFRGVMQNEH